MALSTPSNNKGKGKVIDLTDRAEDAGSSNSSSYDSSSESDSELSDSDSADSVTPEYLESLLEKARRNYRAAAAKEKEAELRKDTEDGEEDVITLGGESSQKPLPPLDPGALPPAYIELGESRFDGPSSVRDPDVELAEKATSSRAVPAPPIPPPELTKSGKPLTHREKKELKNKTAGPDWFDLPAPSEADLPRLYREVEALRLRNQLDPKRFYRKDEGEGKGIKGLPQYFAVGTILPSNTPFGTASADNLPRAHRKRTLVDELVDDAEAKRYAKKKFDDLQAVRGARGKNTLHAKMAMRRGKW
ncbi:putative fcf2-domain-containing protein [Lyophyllum shimeji]|uniref:Fcf2-domain-containing protein n=1 Tax=Lyophyllum shimeji TaxID=47721 RepID=A0A9P3PNB5_LYOSH|nr:putative fcf2-domain-containing protein [Lyophyllum shimeji]